VTSDHRSALIETLANAQPVERIAIRRAARRARTKAVVCRIIAALPSGCWGGASAIMRRIWSGMRDA
jgi:hypothetical protein